MRKPYSRTYGPFGSDIEIAWAAGLFEGEGWATWNTRKHGQYMAYLGVRMTDKDVLQTFHKIVGERGTICEPKDKTFPSNYKKTYQWGAQGKTAVEIATILYPYMHERRKTRFREVFGNEEF